MSSTHINRHSLVVRACHWSIALSGLLLAFSGIGFMPLYGRFYLNSIPGMHWVSDFATQMSLHYLSAGAFMAASIFHLLYHGRRGEFALLPQRGDLRESWLIVKALFGAGKEPPQGKFLAEQRIAYALFALTIAVLVISGYLLAAKSLAPGSFTPPTIQVVTLTHLAFTFIFLLQVVLHLGAFVLKSNRPLLPSIFSGNIRRDYAARRHPHWRVGKEVRGKN